MAVFSHKLGRVVVFKKGTLGGPNSASRPRGLGFFRGGSGDISKEQKEHFNDGLRTSVEK